MSHDPFFTAEAPVWINDDEGVVHNTPTLTVKKSTVGATRSAWMFSMAALAATSATSWDCIPAMPKKKERTEFTDEEKAEIAELSGKEKKRRVAEIRAKYKAANET